MTATSRFELRDELLYMLGLAVAPVRDAIEAHIHHPQDIAIARARFDSGRPDFEMAARRYCTTHGLVMSLELDWILREFWSIRDCLGPLEHAELDGEAQRCLEAALRSVRERIARVPCEIPANILATSPFQSFVQLRSLCLSAIDRVQVFDPYVDDVVYHRYLAAVPANIAITVVTTRDNLAVGSADRRKLSRRDRIVAVSELLAQERPTTYRLLSVDALHDRYLRIDTAIAHLGGSLKDASRSDPYTIAPMSGRAPDASLNDLVDGAEVWFTAGVAHRRA